jgi:hypothetical protein
LEPSEISDKYIPNNLGMIFSERIFVADLTFLSLCCHLVRNENQVAQQTKDKKAVVANENTDSELIP